ncbi:hypothetical protein VP01_793g2 [Puccinia sorghi]|uniref:Uncharacterized protein n=1 Tax=Puccinia sorghi TaxID=27349 RepID=A0A0L6UAV6_9BASI|nr:hypothetical protein VP01_793g2 [Puccinia sorghi]
MRHWLEGTLIVREDVGGGASLPRIPGSDLKIFSFNISRQVRCASQYHGCCRKEPLLAEAILAKLPSEFLSAKQILYHKRPLTIAMIREVLDNKNCKAAAPLFKQESALKARSTQFKQLGDKDNLQCAPGSHNPATAGHMEADCHTSNMGLS